MGREGKAPEQGKFGKKRKKKLNEVRAGEHAALRLK